MIGKSIGRYTIVEKIGEGGMGEVYRATDSSLKRDVALKFLPESMAQDETARRRFLREARSAAALDHPYICQIHEIGEIEGVGFIALLISSADHESYPDDNINRKRDSGTSTSSAALRTSRDLWPSGHTFSLKALELSTAKLDSNVKCGVCSIQSLPTAPLDDLPSTRESPPWPPEALECRRPA